MNAITDWCRGFFAAWNLLIDRPVLRISPQMAASRTDTLNWFPLLGFAGGAVIALAAATIGALFNRIAAGTVFVLFFVAFSEFKDSGRGTRLIASFFANKFAGLSWRDALAGADASHEILALPAVALGVGLLLIAKVGLALALALNGVLLWAAAVFAGDFLIQGAMLICLDSGVTPHDDRRALIVGGVVAGMVPFFTFPAATLVAAVLLTLIWREIGRLPAPVAGRGLDMTTFAGSAAALVLMLVGIFLAL